MVALGPSHVVVTGGHANDADSIDYYSDGVRDVPIPGPRFPGGAAHGSGCTHSSALAAHLALGLAPLEAAVAAKVVAADAVRDGLLDVGAGPGPVDALGVRERAAARGRVRTPLA
jgi:hydroxymethylpyrimidine/phosphomethylpyrimidine kinase